MDQPYDNDELEALSDEDMARAFTGAVKRTMSRFYGYVEYEDIAQEGRLALLEHPVKFKKWADEGKYLSYHNELHRVMSVYAQKQRAAALGYRPEDLFYYSKKRLRQVIPVVLVSWETNDAFEDLVPDRAEWLDIANALKQLSAADQQLVYWAFRGDDDEVGARLVASKLGISETAASSRVDRLLDKIREGLGGENPAPRRRSLSNAASQAATRNQWDGEG